MLEQAHSSGALIGRTEPSMEMPEIDVALARRAQVSIRLREAAVQEKGAEVSLKRIRKPEARGGAI